MDNGLSDLDDKAAGGFCAYPNRLDKDRQPDLSGDQSIPGNQGNTLRRRTSGDRSRIGRPGMLALSSGWWRS